MALFTVSAGFKTLDFQSNTASRVTRSVSGVTQRLKTGAQYWSFKLASPSLTRAQALADYSFFIQQDGQVTAFTIAPPEVSSARGTVSGTLTNDATVAAGLKAAQTDGGSGTLLKGDVIKFSNHNKIYMVTADKTISGTNDAINFYPPLVTGITSSTTITYDNVPFTCYLDADIVKYVTQADGTFKYEIVLNEEI
jgi:hypothetical protein|tara:strand:+ start:10800 stop:11384 length:585 start_codon:yes stop_codon:yes gene_type:complete